MHTETDVVRSSPHCSDDIAKFENVVAERICIFRKWFQYYNIEFIISIFTRFIWKISITNNQT